MSKRMLADVLWEAANSFLTPTYAGGADYGDPFSCNAVAMAATDGEGCTLPPSIREFLGELGCSGAAAELSYISGVRSGTLRLQGIRYMWLLLAMHVAEDEGIAL